MMLVSGFAAKGRDVPDAMTAWLCRSRFTIGVPPASFHIQILIDAIPSLPDGSALEPHCTIPGKDDHFLLSGMHLVHFRSRALASYSTKGTGAMLTLTLP